jgi:predicted DCC family thiol-disulfide oxidoreductase YuxK
MSGVARVLLYDGLCGFCDGTVQYVLSRDPGGALRFAALQGEYAQGVLSRHAGLHGVDSLVLVVTTDGVAERILVRSDAALELARYLGGAWRLVQVLRVVPRPIRDGAYDLFARWRYRLFGRRAACRIPQAAERDRFID